MGSRHSERKKMQLGKTAGFRPQDQEFVDMFNLAMDATGADLSELCLRSIRHGLHHATEELLAIRETARERFVKAHPGGAKKPKEGPK